MQQTTNYHLALTDDETMPFLEWRNQIDGTVGSNMIKIDNALAQKADSSKSVNAVLSASEWAGNEAPYTQAVSIPNLSESQNGIISVSQSVTPEQMDAACEARLYITGQSDGEIIVSANGGKPECDIPITLIIIG